MTNALKLFIALILFCAFLCAGTLVIALAAGGLASVGLGTLGYPFIGVGLLLNLPDSFWLAGSIANQLVEIVERRWRARR